MLSCCIDADKSGEIDHNELWQLFTGLGLGLSEADINTIQSKADADFTGTISWAEFEPVLVDLLKDSFSSTQWDAVKNSPWVTLVDPESQAVYHYNRETGETEWATGEREQAQRLGTPVLGEVRVKKSEQPAQPPGLVEYLRQSFLQYGNEALSLEVMVTED